MTKENSNDEGVVKRVFSIEEKRFDDSGNVINPDDRIPAGFLRRASAFFIDTTILTIPYLIFNLLLLLIFGFTTHSILAASIEIAFNKFNLFESQTAIALTVFAAIITWIVIILIFGIFYHSYLELKYNASFGKKLLSIKVVDSDGYKPDKTQIIERNLLKIISLVPFGAGFIMPIFSLRNESLHDLISKTLVVKIPEAKSEQIIAGHCLGLALAIALYLTFSNEQTTLEQLKPILPSSEISKSFSLKLNFESDKKINVSAKKPIQMVKKVNEISKDIETKENLTDVINELEDIKENDNLAGENSSLTESTKNLEDLSDEIEGVKEEDEDEDENINEKKGFSFSLLDLAELQNKPKYKVGKLEAIGRQWGLNDVYVRIENLKQDTKSWKLNLYFFQEKLTEQGILNLNKTINPFTENVISNNPVLFYYSINFLNKSIVCSRSDSFQATIQLSPLIRKEIYEKAGFYPDSIIALDNATIMNENFFKAPCIAAFKQNNIESKLNGQALLSREFFKEFKWNINFKSKLYELAIRNRIFYEGKEDSLILWNPKLNLLSIANLSSPLTKNQIKKIFKAQTFTIFPKKLSALINIELAPKTVRLSNDSIKKGYSITFYENPNNEIYSDIKIIKGFYETPKMIAGELKQGAKVIGRFEGVEEFQMNNSVSKIQWNIPIDSRVLVIN